MASLNKVMLIGNLGRDPEARTMPNGTTVVNFSLATKETWKNREGKPEERTEWHRIVVFGKQADVCKEYLAKGRQVYVEGRIQSREWEDKGGQKRTTVEIIANKIIFLGGKGQGPAEVSEEVTYEPVENNEEDIPF